MGGELEVPLRDGRVLHAYDTGGGDLAVLWHHGTPNTGAPPSPLFAVSEPLGIRWISYDRPGYGGSTPHPDRSVASAAADAAAVADALGVPRFAVMGHSGGGPHALACAALLPDRVTAAVSVSALSPYDPPSDDGYFAGMADGGVASLGAALAGRAAKERHEATPHDDRDIGFLPADWAALSTDWSWFGEIVAAAQRSGPAPLIDDDLAFVRPWGFPLAAVTAPVLLMHGAADRMVPSVHADRLAARLPTATLRIIPSEGHITVMRHAADALHWLRSR
ncbi:alpha/beta hydrolase [Dactylosporangium aurantiacum]|uniref:Alpha/beta hydrolase n=1 Tax=Dactylosporangium aurantiacum TaxID=35754 RepID=A0A9Q9ICY2_9ACTN|nr:alpha/beta hydrolase [Dactylosporangium aurantiacum]MDG6105228.1 alpha/beta hydrolase [Dactylosporangium aurantiacum]UWZ51742.1 alpha/beta hydrolase [Dactylosporangium aurantiacum]